MLLHNASNQTVRSQRCLVQPFQDYGRHPRRSSQALKPCSSLWERCSILVKRKVYCMATATENASDDLPAELKKLVTTFSMVPDAKLKYQQLLYLGKKLPPLPPSEHNEENKVRGCVSQVWVVPEVKDGKVFWKADSDSLLTKGLAALLVQGLSNCSPEEIIRIQPEFIEKLGLGQALTPSRNNGFLNMFKLMQAKSLKLLG